MSLLDALDHGTGRLLPKKAATPRGRAQDRKLVAGEQAYEVRYVAFKTGHSIEEVKAAIEALGHSRVEIVKALATCDKL